jgi:osmoprotectant transport system substrate-binding protein
MRAGRPAGLLVATVALGLAAASCGEASPEPDAAALDDDAVTVASFDFPESELLAEMYGQALAGAGYDVEYRLAAGPRELVQPALARGLVEFVPEYAGTALEFFGAGGDLPPTAPDATHAALERRLADTPLVPLAPAPAQDANAVVVTPEVAERYDLATISDLRGVAADLTFGGPPGCEERPFCLAGLESVYGLRFAAFMPLDVGGPLTHQALAGGHIDAALLFTTDPRVARDGLVVLADDKALQPAENVTPIVRAEVIDREGDAFVGAVDAVSARLTTDTLQALNDEIAAGAPARDVAARWLAAEGLA